MTTTTRICLDMLTSARARREEYVGSWLPEPVVMIDDDLHEKVDAAKAKALADQIKSEAAKRGAAATSIKR